MTINYKHIYFLGIGGIGMSGLARYFHAKGIKVSGYDKTRTQLTVKLEEEGIPVHYNEDISLIPDDTELVIYTPAIPRAHKEYKYLKDKGYNIIKRSDALGEMTEGVYTIAVAGTHGKTSITCLIAHILRSAGKPVTAFIGGISKNYNSNVIIANNKQQSDINIHPLEMEEIMVVEADEYDRSFLTLKPYIAVVSAMDADHLDIYETIQNLQKSFSIFIEQIKDDGRLIIKKSLRLPASHKQLPAKNIITYNSYNTEELRTIRYLQNEAFAYNIRIENSRYVFDLNIKGTRINNINLDIPGRHNIENAVAAAAAAFEAGADAKDIRNGIETFKGVVRRFDYRVNTNNIVFIDDYAHHPEELRACILAVKELYAGKKITGIFQPHLYSRTRDFVNEFAEVLAMLDELILLDIYPAREEPIEGVTSQIIFEKVRTKSKLMCSSDDVLNVLKSLDIEVLLTLGAGDIDMLVEPIEKYLLSKGVNELKRE